MDSFDNNLPEDLEIKSENDDSYGIGGFSEEEINQIDTSMRKRMTTPNSVVDKFISIYYGI